MLMTPSSFTKLLHSSSQIARYLFVFHNFLGGLVVVHLMYFYHIHSRYLLPSPVAPQV